MYPEAATYTTPKDRLISVALPVGSVKRSNRLSGKRPTNRVAESLHVGRLCSREKVPKNCSVLKLAPTALNKSISCFRLTKAWSVLLLYTVEATVRKSRVVLSE